MTPIKYLTVLALFMTTSFGYINAQQTKLDEKQQSIVTISAFTAKGDMKGLQQALNNGLNTGLTINEIKEILVQLYAYAGFPRSLNALTSFMNVVNERKQKGTEDRAGKTPEDLPTDKTRLQTGTETQTRLVGRPIQGAVFEFAPAIDQYLKEHLFGDIFGRGILDFKTREIATISALATLGGVESQLRSHFNVGMYNGISKEQLEHLVSIIQSKVDAKEGNAANLVLQSVLNKTTVAPVDTLDEALIFPKGERITNNNFTGTAWLQQMILPDSVSFTQVGNVTFEPGARTNWHLHPGGQILLITGGTGYYQEKGSAKRIIKKGDSIKCPPGVEHWHGASKDETLIQVAVTNTQKGAVVWLNKVTDEEYNK